MTFLNTSEDMDWLFKVHLKQRKDRTEFKSAILDGNEDSPRQVTIFKDENPHYMDHGTIAIENYKPL